jgi:hypothetical protein
MGLFAFRRLREQEAASTEAASLSIAEPTLIPDGAGQWQSVIVATPNAANANSYLTLADAQAIIDGFVQDADVTAWATATTDQKNRALFTATQRLDRERYLGARATDTQSLQWPRTGVRQT